MRDRLEVEKRERLYDPDTGEELEFYISQIMLFEKVQLANDEALYRLVKIEDPTISDADLLAKFYERKASEA